MNKEKSLNQIIDYNKFFTSNLDLLSISDTNGKIIKVNISWGELLGYPVDELTGKSFLNFIHPEDLAVTKKELKRLSDHKPVLNFVNRYLTYDGSYRYIEWHATSYNNIVYASARDITIRKDYEKRLMESEANYKAFFETMDDIVIVGNMKGHIIYANNATTKILGYSEQELERMMVIELNDSEKKDEAEKIISEMLAGKRDSCPIALQKKDGSKIPTETRIWFGTWNGEKCIFGISKNLTVQQAAYDRFYKMFDHNPALMAISNIDDLKITEVNSSFLEKLGYSREEIIGKSSFDLNLFENTEKRTYLSNSMKNNGEVKNLELKIRKKNGEFIDGLFSADIIDNQLEKSFLTVMIDITDFKQAEAEMARQSGLILSLLDSIPDLVFYKDLNSVYLGCNPAFERFSGKSRADIIGKTDYDFFDKETADFFILNDKEMLKNLNPRRNEEWITYPDGKRLLVDTMKTPYCDTDGKLIGLLGISRDITEQKEKENEIRFLSFRDQLTGLYNRRFYEDELLRLESHNSIGLTIIMCDVDGLKIINDSFGHSAGDELLIKAATAIKKGCRFNDIIARVGGDEFVIILKEADAAEAENIIKRIEFLLSYENVAGLKLSISFGYAARISKTQSIDEIYKEAEDQMYRNKFSRKALLKSNTIDMVMNTLHNRNQKQMDHSKKVSDISEWLASLMHIHGDELVKVKLTGLMHDIGMVNLSSDIFNKKESLNATEWEQIKRHPEIGYRILSSSPDFSDISTYVLEHHENWDGSGYPKGLAGENISLITRIITLANSYVSMTSERPYKKRLSEKEALAEIKRCSGSQFDPEIVKIFEANFSAASKLNSQ